MAAGLWCIELQTLNAAAGQSGEVLLQHPGRPHAPGRPTELNVGGPRFTLRQPRMFARYAGSRLSWPSPSSTVPS